MVQIVHRGPLARPVARVGFQLLGLGLILAGTYAAAAIGGLATRASVGTWYVDLPKPAWTPPAALVGGVWSALYPMMGVAAWLVWRARGYAAAKPELALYTIQLVLNALWSVLFFGLRSPGLALVEIVVLWIAVVATAIAFGRRVPAAGALLVPYALWVAFAGVVNGAIWWMGR